jgi:hypothetical protein
MPEGESPFTEKNDSEDYSAPGDDHEDARWLASSKVLQQMAQVV